LSVAFAVFSVTMIQVHYDFTYDRNFKKSDNIYLFSQYRPSDGVRAVNISTPAAKEISDKFPEVKSYCLITTQNNTSFDVSSKNGNIREFEEYFTKATVGLLDVFTPEILVGDARAAFTEKNKAMISQSTAHKFFGNISPVGQSVFFHSSTTPITIVAVCKDFPDNCTLKNGVFVQLPNDRPENYNYDGYFEVFPKDLSKLLSRLNSKEFYGEEVMKSFEISQNKLIAELTPLTKIHLQFHEKGSGNLNTTLSLLAIGLLTLVIAYINFLNFSIAMAPSRVRGLNIQKILGANPRILKLSIAAEASLFSLLAFVIALFYVSLFKDSPINEFFSADLALQKNWVILSVIGVASVVSGILFGLYPARYVTSFQPAVALSGSFSISGKSMKLRNTLIVFQFISAISLIIISFFIKMQHDYMQNYSWGIQKENIVYLPSRQLKTDIKTFGEELKKDPRVLDYTASQFIPGRVGMGWGRDFEGKNVSIMAWPVDRNFLHFFGVKIVEGRDFLETDNSEKQKIIFNEEFLKKYELKDIVGKEFDCFDNLGDIVGIAQNVNFESLQMAIRPMAFVILDDTWNNWIFVKISGNNVPATIDYIKKIWGEFSDENFNLKFLDSTLDNLYKQENNLAKLISVFGLIIIIIAVMGVYGLVVFNARYKSKEIALRKVNGASDKEIILMLNRSVLIQLTIAFVVAVPLAYYVVHRWLEGFAYKTPVYWWVFLLAGLLVFLITVITVSWQSWRAATANPVDAIKNE
ncbi:MAG: FtsX-like permease family protein, partial [Smithella sp.]